MRYLPISCFAKLLRMQCFSKFTLFSGEKACPDSSQNISVAACDRSLQAEANHRCGLVLLRPGLHIYRSYSWERELEAENLQSEFVGVAHRKRVTLTLNENGYTCTNCWQPML